MKELPKKRAGSEVEKRGAFESVKQAVRNASEEPIKAVNDLFSAHKELANELVKENKPLLAQLIAMNVIYQELIEEYRKHVERHTALVNEHMEEIRNALRAYIRGEYDVQTLAQIIKNAARDILESEHFKKADGVRIVLQKYGSEIAKGAMQLLLESEEKLSPEERESARKLASEILKAWDTWAKTHHAINYAYNHVKGIIALVDKAAKLPWAEHALWGLIANNVSEIQRAVTGIREGTWGQRYTEIPHEDVLHFLLLASKLQDKEAQKELKKQIEAWIHAARSARKAGIERDAEFFYKLAEMGIEGVDEESKERLKRLLLKMWGVEK